ncbi:MAG: hypothetical protein HYW33_02620 [Candidatus Blackburnbacteria bacterium]|nr:hypothetical protein [Candidatus Blackburnbacteria bacterium]
MESTDRSLELNVLHHGKELPEHIAPNGDTCIVGPIGDEYKIVLINFLPVAVEIELGVDTFNILDAHKAGKRIGTINLLPESAKTVSAWPTGEPFRFNRLPRAYGSTPLPFGGVIGADFLRSIGHYRVLLARLVVRYADEESLFGEVIQTPVLSESCRAFLTHTAFPGFKPERQLSAQPLDDKTATYFRQV